MQPRDGSGSEDQTCGRWGGRNKTLGRAPVQVPPNTFAGVAGYFFLEDTASLFKMLQNRPSSPSHSLLPPTTTIPYSQQG